MEDFPSDRRFVQRRFEHVWHARPVFVPSDAEIADLDRTTREAHDARLIIGDAALLLTSGASALSTAYAHAYDLGTAWKQWTGLPFVFAVWVAQRTTPVREALAVHSRLIESRDRRFTDDEARPEIASVI